LSSTFKLLLIEDSADDADLLVAHLKKTGHTPIFQRVDTETDLRDALKESWDLAICDYNLPQMNALSALAIIKAQQPELPCIVVSGAIGEERAVETLKAGAGDYIMKDNLTRLASAIKREINEAQTRRKTKTIEAELKSHEEQLRQSQKYEAIGQLASGIAHDFNNMLAIILIQVDMLNEQLDAAPATDPLIEPFKKGVEQIKKTGLRASSLTRQLLAFSRKQVILPKVLNLNDLINDMKKMIQRLMEEHIELKTNLSADLKNIKIDPSHFEQILLNLIVNARDAMPQGGALTVETSNIEIPSKQHPNVTIDSGKYVRMRILDTGIGMTSELQKKIFDPFFTTKEVGKGTGLGLSIVLGIVKQNKGFILVESTVNQGTAFDLYFPTTQEVVVTNNVESINMSQLKGAGETILIVEDDPDLRELVSDTLTSNGYKVISASNGAEALEKIKPNSQNINLILTDVIMPQMTGAEMARQIRQLGLTVKILFQSGYTEDTLIQNGIDSGQVFFLEKPYKTKTLLQKIREILR